MITVVLLVLGLCLGSFVNALVWRLHQQSLPKKQQAASLEELSISRGRSMCTYCKHTLAWYDLLPVISWVILGGKCRYCRKPIGAQYPFVEAVTAVAFLVSYWAWPFSLQGMSEWLLFASWIASLVAFVALAVYDIRWMILPDRIVFPLIGISVVSIAARLVTADNRLHVIIGAIGGVAVASGIFYVLFQISDGAWIGGGDVKLGIATGLLLASPVLALLMLFVASLLGLLVALPGIISKRQELTAKVPFGPYLILATVIVMLYGQRLVDWYMQTLSTLG